MRLVIFILNFYILLIGTGTKNHENIEIENNDNYPSFYFLNKNPDFCELQKQNFIQLYNDHEQLGSEFFCSDDIISNMSKQPKYIQDHNIESVNIDQVIDNEFLAYERCLSLNNTKSDINRKKFQTVGTNMADVRICESNNSEVNTNINHNQNIDPNRTNKNKQEPNRLSSFDTLKNYLDLVPSDNMTHAAKDMDIEQQSCNTEIAIYDSPEYRKDKIFKESSIYYANPENTEFTHLLSQELGYHNKRIYDQNDFTKEYIDTEINSANNEYIQPYTFNTFNDKVMHHAQHLFDPDSNIDLENLEETDNKQWIFPTHSNRNLQETNIYANYENNTNLSYLSTFSDNDTLENCYIGHNDFTNSGTDLNSINQIILSDYNCKRYQKDEKDTYLTDLNTTNESNFNIKNELSYFKSNAYQDLITDNNLIHCNYNFQKTNKLDLKNEFYTRENSDFDTAKKQNYLHHTKDAFFFNNLTSFQYNMPLPRYCSEKQTNYEQYIKSPSLNVIQKEENQLKLGNDVRISNNEQSTLCENNDEQKIKIISNKILDLKTSYIVSQELQPKNDIFIDTNSILKIKRKRKYVDEDEDIASDKCNYFENCIFYDKTIIKKHIEKMFHDKKVCFHIKKESENSKIEFFYNKLSYYSMIDYLLSSIIEYFNIENSREDSSNTKNLIYWPHFSAVIDLIKKILVINNYYTTHFENIKKRKYELKNHILTITFFSDLERILNILSGIRFFNLILPEFLSYNDKYCLETCFEKENDIRLDILQIRYFIALIKFVDKVNTSNIKNLDTQNKNIFINIRYHIRKFTFIALQPFLKFNFAKIYNNLIVKCIKPSTRRVINNNISFNIRKVMKNMENIKNVCNSYHIRFLFLYIDFQEIFEDSSDISVGAKNIDKKYTYHIFSKYEKYNEKELLYKFLIWEKHELWKIIDQIKEKEKHWIPYCKILLIYFYKINKMDTMNEKIKYEIILIIDEVMKFFISYVIKFEKLEIIKSFSIEKQFINDKTGKTILKKNDRIKTNYRKNKNLNEKSDFYKLFRKLKKIFLEIEEHENLELQKANNLFIIS